MACKHCSVDSSDVTVDDLLGIESSISCPNSSPCNPCMDLANLEIPIARLENAIARLKINRSELKRNINSSHSPFIRKIPPEIIATISEFATTDCTIIGSLPAPILLSSVCSDWRRIVVGTPQLWTSIKIDLPSTKRTTDKASHRLLRLATFIDGWLACSGQLPLYISLCYGHEHPSDFMTVVPEYRAIFNILDQYSSRWHTLNISIPSALLPFLRPDSLPLLERLHIASESTWRTLEFHVMTFPPTPCLNTVEIQPFMDSRFESISNIGIQWNTVTHVSAESMSTHNCFELLRLIPQLVHCTFHNVIDDFDYPRPESPVLSPLTYLSLHQTPFSFLNYIKLPSLETLVLHNACITSLMAFLERSACSLHTLTLLNCNVRKISRLTQLLQFLSPSLTKLAISRSPSLIRATKKYLSILTQIYTSQREMVGNGFLPHLELFEYREESVSTLESFMLSNLPSRNNPKAATSISLRSAYINMASIIDKPIPYHISSILRHLEDDGILTYT